MSRLHSMAAPMFLVAFAGATPPVAQDTMQEFGRDFRGTINGGGPELRINADRREIRLLRCGRPLGVAMIDPEDAIDPRRVAALRRDAIEKLGVIYDPQVVEKIADCIAEKVRRGTVGEGVTYAELVTGSGVPSWVGHRGLLGHVLALVSLQSYDGSPGAPERADSHPTGCAAPNERILRLSRRARPGRLQGPSGRVSGDVGLPLEESDLPLRGDEYFFGLITPLA